MEIDNENEDLRNSFESSMGESFGMYISPPIPFGEASPNECCEVLWDFLGEDITPSSLGNVSDKQIITLAQKFGEYFESESPTIEQVELAIAQTLMLWPVGSLGENTNEVSFHAKKRYARSSKKIVEKSETGPRKEPKVSWLVILNVILIIVAILVIF